MTDEEVAHLKEANLILATALRTVRDRNLQRKRIGMFDNVVQEVCRDALKFAEVKP